MSQREAESDTKIRHCKKRHVMEPENMCEGSGCALVSVTLPGFEFNGVDVAPIFTVMPLNSFPAKAYLPPTPENMRRFFLCCHFLGQEK